MRASLLLFICVSLVASATFSEAKTGPALKCSPGYTPSVVACKLPIVSGTPLTGSGICCSCPFGSYSDGTTCKQCSSSAVSVSGVDLQKWGASCSCLPGFGDYNPATSSCRRCPANFYSLNNQCVPCAAGTFAAPQSSSCAAVACPTDSYLPPGGAVLADCVRCKFGSAGQSCSNVQSCRCSTGYANFNATTGMCQTCGSNSISVFANFDTPDETKTVCLDCPVGSIASADKRTCTLPTSTTQTTKPTTVTAITSSSTALSFPYPSTPIPSVTCTPPLCLNGYDYTISYENPKDSTQSIFSTIDHSVDFESDGAASNIKSTTTSQYAINFYDSTYIFIADADSGIVVADAVLTPTGYTLFGSGHPQFWNYIGLTCDQVQTTYFSKPTQRRLLSNVLSTSQFVCLKAKQGVKTDLAPQLIQLFGSSIDNGWNINFSFQCAATAAPIKCDPASTASITFPQNGYGFGSSAPYAFGAVSGGTGSLNFGNTVIAFYDLSGTVRFVMGGPANLLPTQVYASFTPGPNMFFSTTHSAVGKTCVPSSTVVCQALTANAVPLASVMNAISRGAATTPFLAFSQCSGTVQP